MNSLTEEQEIQLAYKSLQVGRLEYLDYTGMKNADGLNLEGIMADLDSNFKEAKGKIICAPGKKKTKA